ncbi:MAG TPA: hypothetical protein VMG99_06220 [Thermoplasmata archaeon]|nr:hypothetical protein [Thermoplasmata archaeon]
MPAPPATSPPASPPPVGPGAVPPAPAGPAAPFVAPMGAPSPRRPSRRWIAVGAIVVVAVAVLAALAVSGVFSASSSSNGTGPVASYDQAFPTGAATASAAPGGPWTIVAAIGLGIPSSITSANSADTEVGSGCTFTPVAGSPSTFTIYGSPSSAAPGAVGAWVFVALNGSSGSIVMIAVSGGTGTALVVGSGSACTSEFSPLAAIDVATGVDSTTIAASFNANGGGAFLSANAGATQEFVLLGAGSGYPAAWAVIYSTCGLTQTSGTGNEIEGSYYASNAAPYGAVQTGTVDC